MTRRPMSYGGGGRGGGGQLRLDLRPTPMVLKLMIVLGAIWLLTAFFTNFLANGALDHLVRTWLYVSPDAITERYAIWTPFTYLWFHASLSHVAFNLLALFFLGPLLERRWGARTFLRFFVLAGVIAGIFTVLVGLLIPSWFGAPVLGASGSILGLVAAFSILMPDTEFLLMFILPVKARWLLWIALGIDLAMFLGSDPSAQNIAVQTHVGGAIGGWLLITGNWRPTVALGRLRLRLRKRMGRGGPKKPSQGGWRNPNDFRVIPGGRRDDDDLLH